MPGRWTKLAMTLAAVASMLAWPLGSMAGAPARPPGQPEAGPGGSDYAYGSVATERVGALPSGAWVFSPKDASERERARMPVVLFLHGFGATNPQTYRGWIAHLARRGNIVIYPDYQPAGFLVPDQSGFVANMLAGIDYGLDAARLSPEAVHVVGHSLGGVLGVAYLNAGPNAGLPRVASLTAIAPGGCRTCGTTGGFGVPLPDVLRVPEDLLLHVVTGSDDAIVGDGDARAIWNLLDEVPGDRKRFVEVRSDRHGEPVLVADHLFVQGDGFGNEVNALDWYGAWRPLDSLIACAVERAQCEVALGTDAAALRMGMWSDGTAVASPVVIHPGVTASDRDRVVIRAANRTGQDPDRGNAVRGSNQGRPYGG